MCVESVYSGLPRALPRLDPFERVIQWIGSHPARTPLRLPAANDQAGGLEHLKVTRDRGLGDREWFGQLVYGRFAIGEAGKDRATRRIGERGKRQTELVGRHITDPLINAIIKYHSASTRNPLNVAPTSRNARSSGTTLCRAAPRRGR